MAGTVPSTLHQKVKFVVEENLITIVVEEDMITTTTTTTPYHEVKEDVTECAFRSFEIAKATSMKDEPEILAPHLSKNTWIGENQLIGRGAKVGCGLGKNLQGMNQAIFVVPKYDRYGIGYQFNNYGKKGYLKMQHRQVNFRGQKRGNKSFSHPSLYPMFQSNGYLTPSQFTKSKNTVGVFLSLPSMRLEKTKKQITFL